MLLKHKAKIYNNVVYLKDKERFNRDIEKLNGQEIYITIRKQSKNRSIRQNDYFHGVICKMIADEIGDNTEAVKEALKIKFLSFALKNGMQTIRSTSELSTSEFESFCSNCRQFASQFLGIFIPLPNEIEY